MNTSRMGPNVRRLVIQRASQLQVERAKELFGKAGVGEIAAMLAHDGAGGLKAVMREAYEWVTAAVAAVRLAPGNEKWPDDEAVAGEILRQVAERQA